MELANALVVAERRKRITASQRDAFLTNLAGLDIIVQPLVASTVFNEVIRLATTHQLSVYDATYLGIAINWQLPIATQDEQLIRAAGDLGIALFQP